MYDYDINLQVSSHVEAVLLLAKLNVERHIEVDVSIDELDVTAAESKATYHEIRDYVREHYQLKVSNLYIAQVKQKYGIIERENYHTHFKFCSNRIISASPRKNLSTSTICLPPSLRRASPGS